MDFGLLRNSQYDHICCKLTDHKKNFRCKKTFHGTPGSFRQAITTIQGSCGSKRGARKATLGSKFFHFRAVFGKKKWFAHPLWELAPPSGKSWIRHCNVFKVSKILTWKRNFGVENQYQAYFELMESLQIYNYPCSSSEAVADPGFPRRAGTQTQRRRRELFILVIFFLKATRNRKNWTERGHSSVERPLLIHQ